MEEERFSPAQLSRWPRQALAQWLGRRGAVQAPEAADQLKQLAKDALGPAPEQTVILRRTLATRCGIALLTTSISGRSEPPMTFRSMLRESAHSCPLHAMVSRFY